MIHADTVEELKLAIGVLTPCDDTPVTVPVRELLPNVHDFGLVTNPDGTIGVGELGEYLEEWPTGTRIGVEVDGTIYTGTPAELAEPAPDSLSRPLAVVKDLVETVDVVAPQMIPVARKNLEVLNVVMKSPEGLPNSKIRELLELKPTMASGILQELKTCGLVESVPARWRATALARRAKLVAS